MSSPTSSPTLAQQIAHLRHANRVAMAALTAGRHPFGAILIAPDQTTVLLEQGNLGPVHHAEATLLRAACDRYPADYLWGCTLYSTVEPCAMCAGTQYWANVGQLVYGLSERQLLALTGNHAENPTLDLPCRYLFDHGQKAIQVWGPIADAAIEAEILALHRDFWQQRR